VLRNVEVDRLKEELEELEELAKVEGA